MKKPFRAGRTERLRRMREFHINGEHLNNCLGYNRQQNVSTLPSVNVSARSTELIECHLTFWLQRMTEMDNLRKWLEFAFENKALETKRVTEAYELCLQKLQNSQNLHRKSVLTEIDKNGSVHRSQPSNRCPNCQRLGNAQNAPLRVHWRLGTSALLRIVSQLESDWLLNTPSRLGFLMKKWPTQKV